MLPFLAWGGTWLTRRLGAERGRAIEIAILVVVGFEAIWWHRTMSSNLLIPIDWARALWLPGLTCDFAIGMILALLTVPLPGRRHPREMLGSSLWPLTIVCAIGAIVGYLVYCYAPSNANMETWLLNVGISVCLFVPAALARSTDTLGRWLGSAKMEWLAVVSYGAYLYHRPIIWALRKAGLGGGLSFVHYLEILIPATILSLLAGHLSYRIIEMPFLKLKYGSLRRPAVPAAQQPAPASD